MASIAEIVISARDQASGEIRRVASELRSMQGYTGETVKLDASDNGSFDRSARGARQLESAYIALDRTGRDYASALARIEAALRNAEGDEQRTVQLQRQRIQVLNDLERAQSRYAAGAARGSGGGEGGGRLGALKGVGGEILDGALATAGGIGVAAAAQQLVQFGVDAVRSANDLEKTEATVRVLAGTTSRYTEVLNLARQGQQKYGGTLKDNLDGLGAFVNMANKTGASLQLIDTVARKLQLKSPEQGVEGAMIALNELANDTGASATRSLQTRFELSRTALRGLGDEGVSVQQRMERLNAALSSMGFTDETLAASTKTVAHSYDLLAAAWDNFKTGVGGKLAAAAVPLVQGTTAELGGIANLAAGKPINQDQQVGILQSAKSYEQYAAAVQKVNAEMPILQRLLMGIVQLTPGQFQFAQGLLQQGVAMDQVLLKTRALQPLAQQLGNTQAQHFQQLQQMAPALLQTASLSEGNRIAVQGLVAAYQAGQISAQTFNVGLQGLNIIQQQHAAVVAEDAVMVQQATAAIGFQTTATNAAALAAQQHSQTLTEEAGKAVINQVNSQELALTKERLGLAAQNAANAILASGANIVAEAARLAASASLVDQATAAYLRLAAAQQVAANPSSNQAKLGRLDATLNGPTVSTYDRIASGDIIKQADDAAETARRQALQATKDARTAARGGGALASSQDRLATAGQSKQEQLEYWQNKAAGLKVGSAAYNNALAKAHALEAQIAKEGGAATARAGRAATRDASELARAQENAATAGLDAAGELRYWRGKLGTLKQGSAEYLNALAKVKDLEKRAKSEGEQAAKRDAGEAERIQKAKDALLTSEARLEAYTARIAGGKLPELDRLELVKQIADLEKSIGDEKKKIRDDERDAAIAAIDDHKKRREEVREEAAARRVLASQTTSAEQKAAAQDVLDRIPLEQQKRADEIRDKTEDAARLRKDAGLAARATVGTPNDPRYQAKAQPVTLADSKLPPLPPASAAAAASNITINITADLGGGQTASGTATHSGDLRQSPIANLRVALSQRRTGA